jgi:hypothetical protein
MFDPHYPGAWWAPGYNAYYRAGRNRVATSQGWSVNHYTVGVNSHGIGMQGYFTTLTGRNGSLTQYAEEDAVTWHCGEGNPYGPGAELEYHPNYHDEIMNGPMLTTQRLYMAWRTIEWGVPRVLHPASAGRIPPGSHHGYVDHGAIQQSQPHYDYWPQELWPWLAGDPPPLPSQKKGPRMYVLWGKYYDGTTWAFLVGDRTSRTLNGGGIGAYGVPQEALDWLAFAGRADHVPLILGDPIDIDLARRVHIADHGPVGAPA